MRVRVSQDSFGIVNRVGVLFAPHTAVVYLNLASRAMDWHRTTAPLTLSDDAGLDVDPKVDALSIVLDGTVPDDEVPGCVARCRCC